MQGAGRAGAAGTSAGFSGVSAGFWRRCRGFGASDVAAAAGGSAALPVFSLSTLSP